MADLAAPNLADFTAFLRNVAGFSATVLPDDSAVIVMALRVAVDVVNPALNVIPDIYTLAVYNLGADNVVRFSQDQPGQTFFADLRASLKLNSFSSGVTSSASDEGTSESYLNPDFMKTLTLQDLQNLQTPWGRQYLIFAQMYGPGMWGLT